jgi:hypothetical protein
MPEVSAQTTFLARYGATILLFLEAAKVPDRAANSLLPENERNLFKPYCPIQKGSV